MKKVLSLLVVVVLAGAGVVPALAAPAYQGEDPVIECDPADTNCEQVDDVTIKFNQFGWGSYWYSVNETSDLYFYGQVGLDWWHEYPWSTDIQSRILYIDEAEWLGELHSGVSANNHIALNDVVSTQLADVGTGSYFINAYVWESNDVIQHIEYSGESFMYVSAEPISDCDEKYITLTSDTFEIDPAIEIPLGPIGSPADDQIYTTVPYQWYKLYVTGAWNDGADDRDDAAYSWDGSTWTPLVYIPDCIEQLPETGELVQVYYLQAESETFYIRANDGTGAFGDNTVGSPVFVYTIGITVIVTEANCEAQFDYGEGDWVASVSLPATSEGTLATSALTVGEWYAIEVASGTWLDEGVGDPRTDLEYYNSENYLYDPIYIDLAGGSSGVWCESSDGYTVFVQAKDADLYLRVNNETGGFSNNTGTLGINIYATTFTRTDETCETVFDTSNLISTGVVTATQENGKTFAYSVGSADLGIDIGLEPGAWYYLETTGGPWQYKGSIHQASGIVYDMAVSEDGSTWTSLADWSRPECNVAIDALGHRGVYFQVPESAAIEWFLRVDDNALWYNNAGSMGWNLYGAVRRIGVNPDGTCDFSHSELGVFEGGVSALNEDGAYMYLQPLSGETETYYGLLIKDDSAWRETSEGADRYDVEISIDGGDTWVDFPNSYDGEICTETIGSGVMTYIKVVVGQEWVIRVNSTTFYDNVGAIGWEAFVAEPGSITNPWMSCLDGANDFALMDDYEYIPPKEEAGIYINGTVTLPAAILSSHLNATWIVENHLPWLMPLFSTGETVQRLQPTETYKVETAKGPWTDGESGESYVAALSPDNGVTWYDMTDFNNIEFPIVCGDLDHTGRYYSVYFTMQEGQKWKIRVADDDGSFLDNGGNLAYRLYAVWYEDGGPLPNVDVTVPWSVVAGDACSSPLIRPSSLLEVSNWIEYARLGIQKFIAWCPENSQMVLSLINGIKSHEPFATIAEMGTVLQSMKTEMTSYEWTSEGEDFSILDKSPTESFEMFTDHAYAPIASDNPWESGIVDINSFEDFEMPLSYSACQGYLSPQAGSKLAQGVCYASSLFLLTGASFWIQLILDVGIGILCIKSFWDTISTTVAMATGVSVMKSYSSIEPSSTSQTPYRRRR